jgi:hypothetical protein
MPAVIPSIKLTLPAMTNPRDEAVVRTLIQAQYDALVAVIAQITAKLDADATVTDTNYASLSAAVIATKILP